MASQSYSLRTFWTFLWRFRLVFLTVAASGFLGGLIWYWLTPPVYEVASTLPIVIRRVDGAGWDTLKIDAVYTNLLGLMQSNLVFAKAQERISPAHQPDWQETWEEDTYLVLMSETFQLMLRSENLAKADEFLTAWSQSVVAVLNDPELRSQTVISPELSPLSEMEADLWIGEPGKSIAQQVSPGWLEASAAGATISFTLAAILLLFLFCIRKERV